MPLPRNGRRMAACSLSTLAILAAPALAMPPFGSWSNPANLESLPGSSGNINTPAVDGCASLSRDGLTLIFNSNKTGNFDLYVAKRSSTSEGFGEPVRLPAPVNSSANESCATFAPGGNRIVFASDRDDPAYDLYVTKRGPDGWSTPENLGPNINRPGWLEESAGFYEDEDGNDVMIYSSRRPSGEDGEIYTQRSAGQAARVIRYAAELGPTHGERVVLQVYDCARARWFPVFRNAGHGQGINASVLLEMWRDHGGSLEDFLMSRINDASYRDRSRITHICLYEVTILPRDLPAVTALKQRMGTGR